MIVKDMSRAGRDDLQTGFYTEVFFRQHGVHFIAIANNVDSEDQNSKRFEMLCEEYEQEQAELEQVIETDQMELKTFQTDSNRVQQFMALAKKYTDFTVLTTQMINEFFEKIIVHTPEKINGERSMEIEIFLKFIGKFDVPMPEPTPEEPAAEEAARKRRAANRAKYARRKERERQKKLAEQKEQAAENPDAPEEQTA